MVDKEVVEYKSYTSWTSWLSWTQSSAAMLRSVEKKLLSLLRTPYRGWYVDIGPAVGANDKLWTISLNEESNRTPLVLLHGLCSGVALWVLNLDSFATHRPVYAFDMLGFARSSRPHFSTDSLQAEKQFVRAIEEWRKEMNLERFVLLGHSMGGFLATSYAMDYPDRVKHLILADPWGFPERPQDTTSPLWIRAIVYAVQPFNPLATVRAFGPLGQWLINRLRPDIMEKFSSVVDPKENLIAQYIHQCNVQDPTGESAFHSMMSNFGWAKNPMVNRIDQLKSDIPITIIVGARSWVNKDSSAPSIIKAKRFNSYVQVRVISGAGHHVYADKANVFNKYVSAACMLADTGNYNNAATLEQESEEEDDPNSKQYYY